MFRASCPNCDEIVFMGSLDFECSDCPTTFQGKINSLRIEVNNYKRKIPKKSLKLKILKSQNNQCFWCDKEFGSVYFRYNSIQTTRPNWDHVTPHSFLCSNSDDNFVASCSICNAFKNNHVFETIEACRDYIQKRWDKVIRKRKIVFLEEEQTFFEHNCKKNLNQ